MRREVTVRVTGGEKPRGEYGSAGPGREGQADPLSVSDLEKAVLAWGARCAAALARLWFFLYGCESWTVKKAERRRIDAFELWCWRRLFRVPWIARRSSWPVVFLVGVASE